MKVFDIIFTGLIPLVLLVAGWMIEWAELIEEILPEKRIEVTIEKDLEKGFEYRKITIEERGEKTE